MISFSLRCVPPKITSQQKRVARTANGMHFFKSKEQAAADSGQNKLWPTKDRWALRSITYPGLAAAMAGQWQSN